MTNNEYKTKVLAPLVRKYGLPVGLLTTRQTSKLRNKRGTLRDMLRKAMSGEKLPR